MLRAKHFNDTQKQILQVQKRSQPIYIIEISESKLLVGYLKSSLNVDTYLVNAGFDKRVATQLSGQMFVGDEITAFRVLHQL